MAKTTSLHEHLAAETRTTKRVDALTLEILDTFGHKSGFFDGLIKVHTPIDEETMPLPNQNQRLRASVAEKLNFYNKNFASLLDFNVIKEMTNSVAKADLVINDTVLATDVPATALLNLERRLEDLRRVYNKIPTRDISEEWKYDEEANVYKGTTEKKLQTEVEKEWKVVVPATDKFPAQVKETAKKATIGYWETTPVSGRLSTVEKAALLQNLDKMIIAIKQARARANKQEIIKTNLGKTILNKIFEGVIQHKVIVDQKEIDEVGL